VSDASRRAWQTVEMAAVSSFSGVQLTVRAPTRTASRQQFSVQANTSGPKKVRPADAP